MVANSLEYCHAGFDIVWAVAIFSSQWPGFDASVVCMGFVLDRAILGHIFLKVLKFSFIIYHYQFSIFSFIHIPSTVCSLNTDIILLVWTFSNMVIQD